MTILYNSESKPDFVALCQPCFVLRKSGFGIEGKLAFGIDGIRQNPCSFTFTAGKFTD